MALLILPSHCIPFEQHIEQYLAPPFINNNNNNQQAASQIHVWLTDNKFEPGSKYGGRYPDPIPARM